ncbi:AraC family transcriptional regulator [Gottschalkia acidurici 9a]|uniref:AraC family transcriptional regulator n=1 Tax=Gottschalkia acidurici (strain ATCC 7906 / DSM 604 / BCRC 14475 / CIP 104303 / KCTC 5404 / NCIMB 10678 / 9a) TaxID=1128398 RepID=K0AXF1_GOTA9|nr:AraC family transcriptional regulator [Gottschalkia acidurici]AFS77442.1 AraC family transcriptional regulator [Gottschalkia acidurici 9a]
MLDKIHFPKHNRDKYYHDHDFETSLLNSILSGDSNTSLNIFNKFFNKNRFCDSYESHDLRSVKNHMISLLSVICHNVIKKGVSPYSAKAMHQDSIKYIEKATDIGGVIDLCGYAIVGFSVQTITGLTKFKTNNPYIRKALNYIHDNLGQPLSLDEISDHVHLNKYYFCNLFKEEMKMRFSDYLNHTRIEKSKFFLCHSQKSILDIAILLGFSNQAYFTSVFKKYTGTTPKNFKLKISLITKK